MKIPYYSGNIYDPVVRGHLTIEKWIFAHHTPKEAIIKTLDEVVSASKAGDDKLKQKLKSKLYYITPSVYIPKGVKRQYANIEYFTGWSQIDFDKLGSIKEAEELKHYLFYQFDCIKCAYISPSRLGVKAIINITKAQDVEEYKDIYAAIETEMIQHCDKFDSAPKNCVLPLFISIDKTILSRANPTTWTHKEDRAVDYKHLNSVESEFGRGLDSSTKALLTISQFKEKIDAIVDSDGHPRLRDACLVLGSRSGAGYIDIQQCYELVEWAIKTNSYLNKKYNTYIKSAYWAVKSGQGNAQYY
jgi:hypothetical protein